MQRLSLKQWETILNNLRNEGEEVEVVWLDNGKGSDNNNEWCLCFESELFEDGFKSESEANARLEYIKFVVEQSVVGYFVHKDDEISASTVFVAIDYGYPRLTVYCPIGQHSEADRGWLNECQQITKEQYIEASNGLYTPQEYLDAPTIWLLDGKPRPFRKERIHKHSK